MDRALSDQLRWVDTQHARLCGLVWQWARINSGSYNLDGLRRCTQAVAKQFDTLGGETRWIDLPPQSVLDASDQLIDRPLGQALRITKRPHASRRVLLAIHVDTVYGSADPFQDVWQADDNTLRGPGVVDAKGGLAIMLAALEAFERSPVAERIGWTVLINPDEELGSPGSGHLFESLAKEHAIGLLFEPALPDGSLVGARKGSGSFTVVMHGRAAHAGRDPHLGRNAIHALAEFVVRLNELNAPGAGATVNVGRIEGGGAVNVVPDRASCRFNVRVVSVADQRTIETQLARLREEFNGREGFRLTLHGSFTAPPKPLDAPTQQLLQDVARCGREIGLDLRWRDSGGTCDGNRLAAAGLPNVDSLGPRGGALHSPDEFLLLDSLTERARLTALLLMKLAAGELEWPNRAGREALNPCS
jgi:glutamate carboxypeptidase